MCVVFADGTAVLIEELSAWPPGILAEPRQGLPLGFSRRLADLRIEASGHPPIYQLAVLWLRMSRSSLCGEIARLFVPDAELAVFRTSTTCSNLSRSG